MRTVVANSLLRFNFDVRLTLVERGRVRVRSARVLIYSEVLKRVCNCSIGYHIPCLADTHLVSLTEFRSFSGHRLDSIAPETFAAGKKPGDTAHEVQEQSVTNSIHYFNDQLLNDHGHTTVCWRQNISGKALGNTG